MSTVSTLKSLYTWSTADFAWSAVQCKGNWTAFGLYEHQRTDDVNLAISDKIKTNIGKILAEQAKIIDKPINKVVAITSEQATIQETYWDYINYLLKIVESCLVIDGQSRGLAQSFSEQVAIIDYHTVAIHQVKLEDIVLLDLLLKHFATKRNFNEAVAVTERSKRHVIKGINEQVPVSEHLKRALTILKTEQTGIADLLKRKFVAKRDFAEKVVAKSAYHTYYTENEQEVVNVMDKLYRAANAVIGDISICKKTLDIDSFNTLVNQPAGYEKFIPYVVGEYEYQQALVRLSVEAGSAGAEPAVYDAVIHVDIDDTVDRGTTKITDTSAVTRIHFNKSYYTKPEVAVAIYSGNSKDGIVTPSITAIDSDDAGFYFEVELLKENYERTTGLISWTATGY